MYGQGQSEEGKGEETRGDEVNERMEWKYCLLLFCKVNIWSLCVYALGKKRKR